MFFLKEVLIITGKDVIARNFLTIATFKIFCLVILLTLALHGICIADEIDAGSPVTHNPDPVPEQPKSSPEPSSQGSGTSGGSSGGNWDPAPEPGSGSNPPVAPPPSPLPSSTDSEGSSSNHETPPSEPAVPTSTVNPVITPTPTPTPAPFEENTMSQPDEQDDDDNSDNNTDQEPDLPPAPMSGNNPAEEEPEIIPTPEPGQNEENAMSQPDEQDDDDNSDNNTNQEPDLPPAPMSGNNPANDDFQEEQEEEPDDLEPEPGMVFSNSPFNLTAESETGDNTDNDNENENEDESDADDDDDDDQLTLEILTNDGDLLELPPDETITIPLSQTNSPGTSGGLDLSVYTIEDPDLNLSNLQGVTGSQYWVIDTPGIYNIDTSSVGMFFTTMNAFAILIEVANVILNGNGITINGDAGANSIGVLVKDVSNVIVSALAITEKTFGVFYDNVSYDSEIAGSGGATNIINAVDVYDNEYGVYVKDSDSVTIINSTATNKKKSPEFLGIAGVQDFSFWF